MIESGFTTMGPLVAEFEARFTVGALGIHAAANVVFGEHLGVKLKLVSSFSDW